MKEIIKTIIIDFHDSGLKATKSRMIELPIASNAVVSVIGVRRAGKTYLLFETIKRIIKQQVPFRQILYINLEDERLNLSADKLDLILQSYIELYPDLVLEKCYFFFDEIQNVAGWEVFIRRIFDTVTRNIFITGSNSKLLSSEIATSLRGRTITYTIYPLCFKEYLQFLSIPTNYYGTKQRIELIRHYNNFMRFGGFPEILSQPDDLKIKRLQNYFDTIIYKDLIERYQISNPVIIKFFLKKILNQITKPLSVNKVYNDLKSMGYKIGNNILYEYLDYIQATFSALLIAKFSFSEIKQTKGEKKAYSIDNGLITATNFSLSENKGKLFENMIALELLKHEISITYFKDNYECDFIAETNTKYLPIQVTYSMEDADTRKREIKGLVHACRSVKCNKALIITTDIEETTLDDGVNIKIIPAYKFMLHISDYLD